jgi:putative protease
VTLNTLVFENEMADAERYLRTMIAAGVDAVIVQDVGICRLIRKLSPDFPIHASTQMTISSLAGVEFARELGCQLVVLARECSIKEIAKIRDAQSLSLGVPPQGDPHAQPPKLLPLEVFVHGALCVAYSGQCLTSEALGGRSANRGECAQACRMPYELISDGKTVPLGDRKYLLSPQDLAGLDLLADLVRAGVASLKIEGRLKSSEYVANITRIYRQALDNCGLRIADCGFPAAGSSNPQSESPQYEMEMAFSRGLYPGWLGGINNQQLVHARFGKKRGVYLGEVERVLRDHVVVQLQGPLKPGDGVVFDAGAPEDREEGGRVYEVRNPQMASAARTAIRNPQSAIRNPPSVELHFGRGDVDFSRVHVGDKVWKTSDPELDRRLKQSFKGEAPKFQRPIAIEIHGEAGTPLTVIARDQLGNVAKQESSMPLARATSQPLTSERLQQQFSRLGGTPFRLGELKNHLAGDVLLPVSMLNHLRRTVVAELEQLRAVPRRWKIEDRGWRMEDSGVAKPPVKGGAQLIVLVRSLAQLEAAMACGVDTIYCDFENPKRYRDAVAAFRAHQSAIANRQSPIADSPSSILHPPSSIFVAPPRIFKTGEEWTLEQVRSCGADGYLVRNYDHLKFFAQDRRVGDFSLNIANHLAADHFKNRYGLERVTASYDLNFQQLEALLRATPADWFEITIHQHMPMFHMEHCVFCAFLSTGTDYTNCGRPCDHHDVKLRDRIGAEHPLKADVGCRNTVFHALAQTGAEYVSRMLTLGVRNFRMEFLNETSEQVTRTIGKYQQLLRGEISGSELWRELKLMNQLGVTRGQIAG